MQCQESPIRVAELVGTQRICLLSSVAQTARRRDPARLSESEKLIPAPDFGSVARSCPKEAVVRETD